MRKRSKLTAKRGLIELPLVLLAIVLVLVFLGEAVGAATFSGVGNCSALVNDSSTLVGDIGPCITPNNDGLVVNANDIVIDCQGYKIIGDFINALGDDYGIENSGFDNVTVKNCEIYGFEQGIYYYQTKDGTIYNNSIHNNTNSADSDGIKLKETNSTLVENNSAYYNYYSGIELYNSDNNTVIYNVANNNTATSITVGIFLASSDYNNVSFNFAPYNNYSGIHLETSNFNDVNDNNASDNDQRAISMYDSDSNNFRRNRVINSWNLYGFYVWLNSDGNTFDANFVGNNADDGIHVNQSNGNFFFSNNITNNGNYNIYLNNSNSNQFYDNYVISPGTKNAYDDSSNYWNRTKTAGTNIIGGNYIGGNYWDDYAGADDGSGGRTAGDGIGDTNLPYNSSNNIANGGDHLPLMQVNISCGQNITIDTNLTGNLISNGTCFTIAANNITLDCGGYTITGNGSGKGIDINNNDSITIKNCIIDGFYQAVYMLYMDNSIVMNNTVKNNAQDGFFLQYSTDNNFTDNTIENNSRGFYLDNSDDNNLTNNEALVNNYGFTMLYSDNNTFDNNTANNNSFHGFFVDRSNFNDLTENTANNNTQHGFFIIYSSNNNNITNNTALYNSGYGIYVLNSNYTLVVNNNASSNSLDGLFITADVGSLSVGSEVYSNTFNNDNYGITLQRVSNVTINNNGAHFNTNDGLFIRYGYNSSFSHNNFDNNTQGGVYTPSVGACDNLTFFNNSFNNNTNYGAYFRNLNDSNITDNTINLNPGAGGLTLRDSYSNTVQGNTVNDNGLGNWLDGIYLTNSDNNTIKDNTANGNDWDGLDLWLSDNNTVENNTFLNNNNYQVEVSSSTDIIFRDQTLGNYSFSTAGLIFEDTNEAQLKFLNTSITETGDNLSDDIKLNNNSVFVNSTRRPGFNQSANITLYGINYTDPMPMLDLYDNGTLINCTFCTELSYSGSTYIFNTTHFTTLSSNETPVVSPPAPPASTGGGGGGSKRYQCNDNQDNDGDNLVDYPDDLGCSSPYDDNETDSTCYQSWQCGAWGDCVNNRQTRTCYDENDCVAKFDAGEIEFVIRLGKPNEQQTCGVVPQPVEPEPECREVADCQEGYSCVDNKCVMIPVERKPSPIVVTLFILEILLVVIILATAGTVRMMSLMAGGRIDKLIAESTILIEQKNIPELHVRYNKILKLYRHLKHHEKINYYKKILELHNKIKNMPI